MRPPPRRHARRVILAAAATFLVAAAMAIAGSGMPPASESSPYATAIVALELARTPAEVLAALGPPSGDAREVLRRVVLIDFGFLVLYPLLSVALVAFLARERPWRIPAVAFAVAMAAGDALENRALLAVLEEPSAAALASLGLWTTVKWAALFASTLLVAVLAWRRGGLARGLAGLAAITSVAGLVGLVAPAQRALIEIAGIYGTGLTWLVVTAMAMASFRKRS